MALISKSLSNLSLISKTVLDTRGNLLTFSLSWSVLSSYFVNLIKLMPKPNKFHSNKLFSNHPISSKMFCYVLSFVSALLRTQSFFWQTIRICNIKLLQKFVKLVPSNIITSNIHHIQHPVHPFGCYLMVSTQNRYSKSTFRLLYFQINFTILDFFS